MTFISLRREKCTWDKMRISEMSRINKKGEKTPTYIGYAASFQINDSIKRSGIRQECFHNFQKLFILENVQTTQK